MAHPIDDIVKHMRSPSTEDREIIRKAYDFAEVAHGNEKRKSGEPYIAHPHAIACYLAELGMDRDTIVAGILHDTTEDTSTSIDEVEKEFGSTVRFLVESLTKLSKLKYHGLERHVESLRNLLIATASDIRVIIIKMADRLHNMRTIEYVTPLEKRQRIARDTMEVYVPVAERLGMGNIKAELEDLAFGVLEPERYVELTKLIEDKKKEVRDRVEDDIKDLKRKLAESGMRTFRTEYRLKGVHSFAQKARRKYHDDFSRVYDLFALRLMVKNTEDCYRALGIVHGLWRPIPGKVKDYIAFPKPNGYQSIHTTVITHHGVTMEIQIRTDDMHHHAQFGIAAHFGYKHKGDLGQTTLEWLQSLMPSVIKKSDASAAPRWLNELSQIEREHPGFETFEEILKKDFFAERMFVFTPHGDVIDLPIDATAVDFAYNIHSDVGNAMAGAKVNGKLVSLDTKLNNGDMVEILTRKNTRVSKKWLDIAKTASAKAQIRGALRKQGELEN